MTSSSVGLKSKAELTLSPDSPPHLGEWVPTPGEILATDKHLLSFLNAPTVIKPVANWSRGLDSSAKALLLVGETSWLLLQVVTCQWV